MKASCDVVAKKVPGNNFANVFIMKNWIDDVLVSFVFISGMSEVGRSGNPISPGWGGDRFRSFPVTILPIYFIRTRNILS